MRKRKRVHRFTMTTPVGKLPCAAVWSEEDDAYLVICFTLAFGWLCHGRSLKAAKRHVRIVLWMNLSGK